MKFEDFLKEQLKDKELLKEYIKCIKFQNVIKAEDIPIDDEWIQDNYWDEEYKNDN